MNTTGLRHILAALALIALLGVTATTTVEAQCDHYTILVRVSNNPSQNGGPFDVIPTYSTPLGNAPGPSYHVNQPGIHTPETMGSYDIVRFDLWVGDQYIGWISLYQQKRLSFTDALGNTYCVDLYFSLDAQGCPVLEFSYVDCNSPIQFR